MIKWCEKNYKFNASKVAPPVTGGSAQDDRFFFIAGYTSGGAPYGVTWEEMGLKPWEDLEENN